MSKILFSMKMVGLGLILLLTCSLWSCQTESSLAKLEKNIRETFAGEEGTFALAWKDLQTGDRLLINEKDLFHAASTMKTPVMIEVYKQAAIGRFSLQDSITVKNEFFSIVDSSRYQLNPNDDSEKTLYTQLGTRRSIADLVYDMIIVSSNLATNIIIELVDAQRVTESMRALGAGDIQVLRGVEDIKAYEQGLSNRTTAYDLMLIYEKLARGEVVSPEASREMVDILHDQRFNEIIPALLPGEVRVAHKTGVISGLHHDSGIVYLPDGRSYVLVLLSRDMVDFDAGTAMLARVSKMIYDYLQEK